jgi:hypothetical protein
MFMRLLSHLIKTVLTIFFVAGCNGQGLVLEL